MWLDDDFIALVLNQFAMMRATDDTVKQFVATHLDNEDTISQIALTASEKMGLALNDGLPHSGGWSNVPNADDEALYLLNVSALPVGRRDASRWFAQQYGGYVEYINRYYQGQGRRVQRFKVLVHFIVGCDEKTSDRELWATHGIFSFADPHLRWIFPSDCLSPGDRMRISELRTKYGVS